MARMRNGLVGCVVASALIVGCPAQSIAAGLFPFSGGITSASFIPALIGEIGGVGTVTAGATRTGQVITVGSGLVTLFDPPGATFIDGRISLNFDPAFLEVTDYGWLGDWGANADEVSNVGARIFAGPLPLVWVLGRHVWIAPIARAPVLRDRPLRNAAVVGPLILDRMCP